ncbi:replicative DNA helicase [Phyllobacterium ifriqiyense]|uniref:DNA 5'-3' helicase n=1 Tax=Phyllobacterium ifriqiyense TaxID=314238 RepID=A0ABU0S820_9HYPH|nr:DnaB-like helicase C-terminal domain-containing protein [Phyllobacterium ifriqiyense]MDQ0996899.1 replicative DNA helicase [Phyllobacterium ifriqiyense]
MTDQTPIRIVPQDVEAEGGLIASILVDNTIFDSVSRIIEPKHFNERLFARTYEIISEMLQAGKHVSPITVKSKLPEHEIVSEGRTVGQFLLGITDHATGHSGARGYAEVIHEMWIRRQSIVMGEELAATAYSLAPEKNIIDEIASIEERLIQIRAERLRESLSVGIGHRFIESLNGAYQSKTIKGVGICLPEICDVISEPCFEAGNLYGLLSSSGEGKTSLTIQLIYKALRDGHPVQFQSYDQSPDQCIRQMVAQEYGIEARRQRSGEIAEKEFAKAMELAQWIDSSRLFEVIECNDETAPQLAGYARNFIKRRGNGKVPFIVTDHIGSVAPRAEDARADEGTKAKNINKVFKSTAKHENAVWLVLNQRNSKGMSRDNPRPIAADLYGGEGAKQAYDAVIYLYRQEKFKAERVATAASDRDWKTINKVFAENAEGIAELGAIKVRFGNPTITARVEFEARFTRYVSLRQPDQPEML